jgi:FkbM family methyltransferase
MRKKSLAARIYRATANAVEPLLPKGARTPAHYLSRRLTNRLEAEYDFLMDRVKPGTTAIDVGANIGVFTYGFLARGANVVAIEPQSGCAAQIRAMHEMGFPRSPKRGSLKVHVEAVSNQSGSAMLYVPLRNGRMDDESASLKEAEGEAIRIEVPVRQLDDYGLDNVSVIKMDVEGREIPALEGGRKTIRRWRPIILVEIEQRHHAEPIAEVFSRINETVGPGYSVCYLDRAGRLRPLSEFDVQRDQLALKDNPLSRAYVRNFFFMPERTARG